MSFLAPFFMLGALAVGLPIVFHLIRRSSSEHIPFSSLMFLSPAPPRVTKRSRLEHLLLLLLRCLVICLLALGFARPFFHTPSPAGPAATGATKIILLVDTSASMRREGLWPGALAKAGEVLAKASPGAQVAVFTFDNQAHPVVTFAQWAAMSLTERAPSASARLAELKPGWASTHLGNALITAAEYFSEADKDGPAVGPRRIVLISDLQEGSQLDSLQGYDWPHGLEVQVERIRPRHPTNAGLQWIMDNAETAKTDDDPMPRIRVSNSADATREQFQIRWADVPGAQPLDVYVPPGQSRVVPAPRLPPNTTGERLVLTGDDDDFDNTLYLIQPKPRQTTVIFLGDESEKDSTQPLYYLKRAFQETRDQAIAINAYSSTAPLPPADLDKTRLLIAAGDLPDGQVAAAQKFLADGGTVLFVMNKAGTAQTIGRLAGVNDLTATEVSPPSYALFGQIEFQHPLFSPFADSRFNDFTKIHFWKYRKLDAAQIPGARVLAQYDSGDPVLIEIPKGKGRLLVLTSGWQPTDSQLALSSKFVPLLYSILDGAGGVSPAVTQLRVGEKLNLSNFGSAVTPPLTVVKPDGAQVPMPAGETNFTQTDLPGIYKMTSAQAPVSFAVNLDGAESRTAPLPIEQLEHLGVPMKVPEVDATRLVEKKRMLHDAELEEQQKLWRWLTLAALMVLLGETWLAGWYSRRISRNLKAAI
jgi:hypothetical protein